MWSGTLASALIGTASGKRDRPRQQMQPFARRPIDRVMQDRAAELGAMHPDLMGSSRSWRQFEPRPAAGASEHPPLRPRRLSRRVDHHAPAAGPAPFQQRRVHHSGLVGRPALDDGPIDLAHRSLREQRLHLDQRRPPQRHHQASGRVCVQSVRQPRSRPAARQQRKPILHAGPTARTRMHRQPGRFVQHHQSLAAEQNRRQLHAAS